jgi:hypothetical protein
MEPIGSRSEKLNLSRTVVIPEEFSSIRFFFAFSRFGARIR